MRLRAALGLLSLLLLAACAGTRPYTSDAPKNLTVRSAIERGVKAQLHVHSVNADCSTDYRGSVALDRPSVELAIPQSGFTYLVVSFDTSSFFGGSRSSSVGTLLKAWPRQGYELAVSYKDDVYNVAVREAAERGRPGRELPRRDLVTCGAG